jgi:hypothetical protein
VSALLHFLSSSGGSSAPSISRWSTRRTNFVDASGQIVKYRGCTGFMLLRDRLLGIDRTTFGACQGLDAHSRVRDEGTAR